MEGISIGKVSTLAYVELLFSIPIVRNGPRRDVLSGLTCSLPSERVVSVMIFLALEHRFINV
jgi:hypothetical protein